MVFKKAARTEVRQTILHSIFLHALCGDSTDAFICRHPDVAMPTLQERTYKIVRQLIRGGVVHYAVRCYVVGTASVCTHPQIALAVAKYISHHHVREFFEACRSRYAVSDSINSRSHGPQGTIAIAGDRSKVGIRTTGERNHSHRSFAQPYQTILQSDPDLMAVVLEYLQDSVAGQQTIQMRESSIFIGPQSFSDRAH